MCWRPSSTNWASATLVSIEEPRFARPSVSHTFEGRDRFGPAAAWIAAGTPVAELGPALAAYVRLERPGPTVSGGRLRGTVVWVDTFGNLVTDISRNIWQRESQGRTGRVWLNGVCAGGLVRTYADGPGQRAVRAVRQHRTAGGGRAGRARGHAVCSGTGHAR